MFGAPTVSRTWSLPSRDPVAESPRESEYSVSVVGSVTRWAELRKDWNDLLTRSHAGVVFLTWEWLYTWAESFWGSDRELFILAVSKGGELVGIAPWCIRRCGYGPLTLREIEFLGDADVASDYLDVFAARGKEKEVARRIYQFLFHEARSRWDVLALLDIPADSLFLLHFLNETAEDGKHVEMDPGVFCPIVQLPGTQAEFMASLSAHRRRQFMRHQRILQRSGKVEHSTTTSQDGLDAVYSLYQWKSGTQKTRFHQFLRRFLTRAGAEWVQIDLLTVGGNTVAGLLHLRYGATLFQYLHAIDKTACPQTSVGNLLIALCLQKASAENVAEYDILRGTEDYKFYWATGGRRSLKVRLYQRRLQALLLVGLQSLKAPVKVLLR